MTSACSAGLPGVPGPGPESAPPTSASPTTQGTFEVRHAGDAVGVHWVGHVTDAATADVLFVMHGTNRNADDYCATWGGLIGERNLMVVCPEFDSDSYPGADDYNLGRMVADGRARPRAEWTFGLIERIHQQVIERLGGRDRPYDMFGHSAGAQFVHRYVLFAPGRHLRRAIAANAGWYTTLEDDVEFPYGLGDAPARVDVKAAARRDLVVMLGEDDVEDTNLRTDDGANRQGETRVERGEFFFRAAQDAADAEGVPLRWTLHRVPGARHDHAEMSAAALDFLP